MSLEAIKKVAQTEAETKQRKAEAAVTAKKLVADAEQAGNESLRKAQRIPADMRHLEALRKARTEAEAKSRELLAKAEERAAVRTAEIAAQSKQECAALCSAAESKLEEAAALIVRRVVSS